MLDNTEKSKLAHAMLASPAANFPHPINKHLGKFSQQELTPLRRHVGEKLVQMHYAKQLEDMFELYDCYDLNEAKKIEAANQYYQPNNYNFSGTLAPFAVLAFLKYKKLNVFNFSSYLNNIYAVSYITFLSYAFMKFCNSYNKLICEAQTFKDGNIITTRNLIHSYNTNIINNLRFEAKEAF
jgi:hypothetical protein